ncbi:RNA polymerase sigma factor [Streptomyces hirsutus]|uniref:RNA polymerase sigma factor n=1 Tax=Streptomyces hirsutus TaxID=35620 RepID=UPI00331D7BE3
MSGTRETSVEDLLELYESELGWMTGVARRLLSNEQIPDSVVGAEDVVHAAFAKALCNPARIRQPRAYLYQVIRNEVGSVTRKYRHKEERERPLMDSEPVPDFSSVVVDRVALHHALKRLSVQQRTAVWATKALDLTQAQTAAAMGRRPGTVATHVARAMAFLATVITAVTGIMLVWNCLTRWRIRVQEASTDGGVQSLLSWKFVIEGLWQFGAAVLFAWLGVWVFKLCAAPYIPNVEPQPPRFWPSIVASLIGGCLAVLLHQELYG